MASTTGRTAVAAVTTRAPLEPKTAHWVSTSMPMEVEIAQPIAHSALSAGAQRYATRPRRTSAWAAPVLGPVEVRRDGRLVPVPGGKTSELLVRLALEAGLFVGADRLVDDLWAGAATRRNTLQSKVARLRRALGDPLVIASGDGGY